MMRKNNLPDTKDLSLKQAARRGLKTMQKTRAKHPLREEGRIIKYGTSGFARNIWLSVASTAVMVVALVIVFITIVAGVILGDVTDGVREKIVLSISIEPGTSDEVLQELAETLLADENVKSIEEVSNSEREYEKVLKERAKNETLQEVLGEEEFHEIAVATMPAAISYKVYDANNLDSVKEVVEGKDSIFADYLDVEHPPSYDTRQKEIDAISRSAFTISIVGAALATVFLVISVLIIFSTIRMAIFSRREEIYMMKLVGADRRFIRGPFLVEAEICGLTAGVLAATLCFFGFRAIAPWLNVNLTDVTAILEVLESSKLVLVYLAFIAVGIVIGRASAWFAISKYLHKA